MEKKEGSFLINNLFFRKMLVDVAGQSTYAIQEEAREKLSLTVWGGKGSFYKWDDGQGEIQWYLDANEPIILKTNMGRELEIAPAPYKIKEV